MTTTTTGLPTDRELEILILTADGLTNAAIGQRLYIGEDTVKTHLRRLMHKLGAANRTHAVRLAVDAGLLAGGPVTATVTRDGRVAAARRVLLDHLDTRRNAPQDSRYAQLYDQMFAALHAWKDEDTP